MKETVSVSENHSSQTQEKVSSDKGEESTKRQEENTETYACILPVSKVVPQALHIVAHAP